MNDLYDLADILLEDIKMQKYASNQLESEFDASAEWDKIPFVDCYPDAEPITDYEECPYCGAESHFTDDIYPPGDSIGIEKISRYTSRLYRKCPKCGKIFYEDLGEEPDYQYY